MSHSIASHNASDRLALTLFFALLVHALFLLGVSFSTEDFGRVATQSLKITLVHQRSEEQHDDADVLAQVSQDGGEESETPTETSASPMILPLENPLPAVQPTPVAAPPPPPQPQVTETISVKKEQATVKPQDASSKTDSVEPTPSANELVARSLQMATLSSEIAELERRRTDQTRRRTITTRTREFRDAAYFESWRNKIERIGNLNYPEEARRRNLSGRLRLDVGLFPDGEVESITVVRSSGNKVLDDAAIRIVKLAAPFAPFPVEMRADTDVLVISRIWEFGGDSGNFSSH